MRAAGSSAPSRRSTRRECGKLHVVGINNWPGDPGDPVGTNEVSWVQSVKRAWPIGPLKKEEEGREWGCRSETKVALREGQVRKKSREKGGDEGRTKRGGDSGYGKQAHGSGRVARQQSGGDPCACHHHTGRGDTRARRRGASRSGGG